MTRYIAVLVIVDPAINYYFKKERYQEGLANTLSKYLFFLSELSEVFGWKLYNYCHVLLLGYAIIIIPTRKIDFYLLLQREGIMKHNEYDVDTTRNVP